MNDSVIKGTNNSKKIRATLPNTYAQFKAQMATGQECDMMINSTGYNQVGSAYSKANVLPDATCSKMGITSASEPKDAFNQLADFSPIHTAYNNQLGLSNNLLSINTSNPYADNMKPTSFGTENASTLVNSPVTSGAFYGVREVFCITRNSPTGDFIRVLVRLTEAYPVTGRIWINVYEKNTSQWTGWKKITPTT